MDNRGLTPVISKALSIGIVVLYIGILTTVLYGSVIPEYRMATANEVSDRTLATAAERVQQAVPPPTRHIDARFSLELPGTIQDQAYSLQAANRSLVLNHPHPNIGGRVPLVLPRTVIGVEGKWQSHETLIVRVVGKDSRYIIKLSSGNNE